MSWHRMHIIVNKTCTWLKENSHKIANIISIYLSTLSFVCYVVVSQKKKKSKQNKQQDVKHPVIFSSTFLLDL